MGFEERLRHARQKKNLSQDTLAEKLAVSRQAVSKWERGECYPDLNNVLNIAAILEVSLDWLWAEELFRPDESLNDCDELTDKITGGREITQFSLRMADTEVEDIIARVIAGKKVYDSSQIVETGINSFDKKYGGLHRGEKYLLGSRTSMGRTLLALNITCNLVFGQNKKVLFYTLETPAEMLLKRILAIRTGLDLSTDFNEEDRKSLVVEGKHLRGKSLIIDDTPDLNLKDIYRKSVAEKNLDLIVIDQYRFLSINNPYDVISLLSHLTRECNCPIIMTYALPPELETREDKIPKIADIPDSQLTRCMENIFFIYRPKYYDRNAGNEGYLVIARESSGIKGKCRFEYEAETQRIK